MGYLKWHRSNRIPGLTAIAPLFGSFRRLFSLFILLNLLTGCDTGKTFPPVQVEEQAWSPPGGGRGMRLLTEHYDLRSTLRDDLLQSYLPAFMETAHAAYRDLIPPEQPTEQRLVTYVFGTRSEWALFTRSFVPAHAETYLHIHSGGYMDHPSATSVFWDIGRDRTLSLMAHEGLHQYLARHFPDPFPPWLNEGLATQFEAFDLDGPYPTFTPRRNFLRTNSLREALSLEKGLIPLDELLRMHAGQAVVQSGQPTRAYYAQLWSLILFLRENDNYRPGFERLLTDAGTAPLHETVAAFRRENSHQAGDSFGRWIFRCYITQDLDNFWQEYRDYARRLVY